MSGINKIKNKTKLSINELYDNQLVGKLDNQKVSKPESKQNKHPAKQQEINQANHPAGNQTFQKEYQPVNHPAGQTTIHQTENPERHLDAKQEHPTNRQTAIFPTTKQQTQKVPTYKMTFNLTEDIYKAFNDLYANRMLQGRKTEKSEMICEAIQWLIKMEEEPIK